jgi:hypothetical protein
MPTNKKNLFTATAPAAPVAKKGEKPTVNLPQLAKSILAYNEAREQIDALEAKKADAEATIHEAGRKAWLDMYQAQGHNPDSLYLEAGGNRVMYIPTDKYKSIDQERAEYLKKTYGESFVSESTEFGFDPALIEKYGQILSDLILGSKKIDTADKGKLIIAKTKVSVAKGSIDRILTTPEPRTTLAEIAPVVSLKRA